MGTVYRGGDEVKAVMETIQAFPLTWPDTMPRKTNRDSSRFKASLSASIKNVKDSLRLFGSDSGKVLSNLVISSNVSLGAESPKDPGVAVWFTWDGMQVCIAVDRYQTVAANLQAIHHIIEARRVEMRHGGLSIVRATFRGFVALPAPSRPNWWEVLGVSEKATKDQVAAAYRTKAKAAHPDAGGSAEAFQMLQDAYAAAMKGGE